MGFERRVGSDDLVSKGHVLGAGRLGAARIVGGGATGGDERKVLDDLFGVDGLTGTRLASDAHRLVLAVGQHLLVGGIGDGVQVGRHFVSLGYTLLEPNHARRYITIHYLALEEKQNSPITKNIH